MQKFKILILAAIGVGTTLFAGSALLAAEDAVPPSTVTNLAVESATQSSVGLTWTAPGDDGSTGTASSYDVRFRTEPITESNFATSSPVAGEPSPHVAGTTEHMIVTGLVPTTTYWLALRSTDDAGNTSSVSNSVSTTTPADTGAPTISSITVTGVTTNSANVNWNTNENASSLARYGLNSSYGSTTATSTLVMNHTVPLLGLTPATLYHFSVSSADAFGNTATSTDRTFMTLATTTPPFATTTIHARLHISPQALNIKRHGKRIQTIIRFPKGTTFEGLDPQSIRLNGTVKPVDTDLRPAVWNRWGKFRRTLIAKFKTEDILPLIPAGAEKVTLTLTGNVKAGMFTGTDSIKIVPKPKKIEIKIDRLEDRLEDARERLKERQEDILERFKKQEERVKKRLEDLNNR